MISLQSVLVLFALLFTLVSAFTKRPPLWVAVLFLCLALLVGSVIR